MNFGQISNLRPEGDETTKLPDPPESGGNGEEEEEEG